MTEDYTATVRIRRPAKVTTDDRGRTVWAGTVETAQLELVSTAELEQILASEDKDTRSAIHRLIEREEEGVLARDPATGLFEIVSDTDLKEAIREQGGATRGEGAPASDPGDEPELSLVSTQVLRKVLTGNPDRGRGARPVLKPAKKDEGGGFNPYDSG